MHPRPLRQFRQKIRHIAVLCGLFTFTGACVNDQNSTTRDPHQAQTNAVGALGGFPTDYFVITSEKSEDAADKQGAHRCFWKLSFAPFAINPIDGGSRSKDDDSLRPKSQELLTTYPVTPRAAALKAHGKLLTGSSDLTKETAEALVDETAGLLLGNLVGKLTGFFHQTDVYSALNMILRTIEYIQAAVTPVGKGALAEPGMRATRNVPLPQLQAIEAALRELGSEKSNREKCSTDPLIPATTEPAESAKTSETGER